MPPKEEMTKVKIGMGQMLVLGGEPEKNLARAAGMIRRAGAEGCAAVVLPECLDLGWTDPSVRELAQPIPGKNSDLLCQAAREAGILVAAGLTEREGDKFYNSAVLISSEGRLLKKHR